MSRIIAALNLPRTNGGVLVYARFVAERLADDPRFSSCVPTLDVFEAHIASLYVAEAKTLTRERASAAVRDALLRQVQNDLFTLKSFVQTLADVAGPNASSIVEAAGMSVKQVAGPSKEPFTVKRGRVSGSVHLVAKAERTRASYEWEYGTDGDSWILAATTVRADASLHALVPATRYFFRYRAVSREGTGNWSQVLSLLVV